VNKRRTIKAVDLFAGAGGASNGLVQACHELGFELDLLAINHWPTAVETHKRNHPGVRHLCESVENVDPREAVPGGRLHILLAGPECTHFSTARGGRPVNPQSRASAWHVLKWAQEIYIDSILIENVPEFRTWGPIGANQKPLKSRKGETYHAFLNALRSLGYKVEDRILNAADYGDPTTRRRLFIMATRGRHRIAWPEPSHSKRAGDSLFNDVAPWATAREAVIDWDIKGKSIFNRKKALRPATMARILAGLEKFGGPELKPFLVILRNHADAQSVDQPVPTLVANGQHLAIAEPSLMNHVTLLAMEHGGRELDPDKPLPTITTARGGAHGVAEALIHTTHGGRANDVDAPVPTVTGAHRGEIGIAQAYVLGQQSGAALRPDTEPTPTVAAGGAISLIEPFLVSAGGPEGQGRTANSVDEPLPTVLTENHRALIETEITPASGQSDSAIIVDAGFGEGAGKTARRGPGFYSPDEPLGVVPCSNRFAITEPILIKTSHVGGNGGYVRSVDEPIMTATGREEQAIVEPFIVPHRHFDQSEDRVDSVDEPLRTITAAAGRRFGLAEPYLTKYYGNEKSAQSVDEPVDTLTAKDRVGLVEPFISIQKNNSAPKSTDEPIPTLCTKEHMALVEPFVVPNNTNNVAQSVDGPVPTVTGANRLALVQPIINGYKLDILFRMLQPHELAAAMSFPKEYEFVGTREAVVKQIGNAWAGKLAKALCKSAVSNLFPLSKKRQEKAA
jgi:DNA (cytosine-5)-methyltransferase 1